MERKYEVFEWFQGSLPRLYREERELGSQSVQVVAWLVGFSIAMGALLLTGLERMPYLGAEAFKSSVMLLTLAILAGVLHRVAYHWADSKSVVLLHRFEAEIGGFLLGAKGSVTDPSGEFQALARFIGPYMGVSEEEASKGFSSVDPERTRRQIRVTRRVHRFADCLYYLTSVAFMAAIVVLAWNLLRHAAVNPT